MRRKKKTKFFLFHRPKLCVSLNFFIAAIGFAGLAAAAVIGYVAVYGKDVAFLGKQILFASEKISASSESVVSSASGDSLALASSPALAGSSLNLSSGIGVYVMSKKTAPCKDYKNTLLSNAFGFRCKTGASAIWRGLWTKKIDVAGYSKLRVTAFLTVNDYTDYFAECGHKGTNRDDFVDLIALSSDPNPKLRSECNHEIAENKWSECFIDNEDASAITHCGIPKCNGSQTCDIEIDVSGKEAIYLLFSTRDAWQADIEGVLSDVKISLTE